MAGHEVLGRVRRRRADQVVVEVLGRPAREHVLAGELVAAVAGEALLVAVVDDRVATRQVHQRVRELVAGEPLGVAGARVRGGDEVADPAHVVVAEEGRHRIDVGVGVRVPVVVLEERLQGVGRLRVGREALRGGLEREVEHGLDLVGRREARLVRPRGVEDLAEHEEVALALLTRVAQDRRPEALPERVVDVLHRVDPEAVDAQLADPGPVDADHAADHARVLGEQVVEAEEVAVERVLAGERRVAAVVVERDVVEPAGDLEVALGGIEHRRVGEARVRVERREAARAGVVAVVEHAPRGVLVRHRVLRHVRPARALLVADDVGGVVRDDVEVDLHPAGVGGVDERPQVRVRAQVRVDLREVGDPVAVVAGARPVLELHGLVLEARREPDRVGAQALDVVDPVQQALQVAAVVEALGGRVEPVLEPAARDPAVVVGRVAVLEPVGHDEVEVLVGDRLAQRMRTHRPLRGHGEQAHGEHADGQNSGAGAQHRPSPLP